MHIEVTSNNLFASALSGQLSMSEVDCADVRGPLHRLWTSHFVGIANHARPADWCACGHCSAAFRSGASGRARAAPAVGQKAHSRLGLCLRQAPA